MPNTTNTRSVAQLVLRVGIGIIFLYHGAAKLFMMPEAMSGFFESIGLPGFFSYVVGAIELLGGMALLFGIATRWASAALSVILLGAIFRVKWAMGFVTPQGTPGWEFDFALLAGTLSLALSGIPVFELGEVRRAAARYPGSVSNHGGLTAAGAAIKRPEESNGQGGGQGTGGARAPRIAVIYYSSTGNTHKLAEAVAEGARGAGAEVRLLQVAELAPESAINQNPAWRAFHDQTRDAAKAQLSDLEWADGIIMGSPTRFGNIASQLKQFIDTTGGLWFQGKLANKAVAGFVTASNVHGGQESTVLTLYTNFYHWGAIVVPPGYTDQVVFTAGGNPYGASATGTETGPAEAELTGAQYLGKRIAAVAAQVAAGRAAQA